MNEDRLKKFNNTATAAILSVLLVAALVLVYKIGAKELLQNNRDNQEIQVGLENQIAPPQGVRLPVKWGDLGIKMVEAGVIDGSQFDDLYSQRNGLGEEEKKMIEAADNGDIIITRENSGLILNLLWALGLGNENKILQTGPMMNPQYGGAGNFASTGGWTLSQGGAMTHYAKHQFVPLTEEQQQMVERVAKDIYRPCCGNSTYFPDCNHGMAMLGFLELAAFQGFSENALYQMALVLNSYWFPNNYLTIAQYFQNKGIDWSEVDAKQALGMNFSSGSGYQKILNQVQPKSGGSGGSCGV